MKNLCILLTFECCLFSILVLDFNYVLVNCQVESGLAPFWQHLLAALPTKILGLIQIGLLARLVRNNDNSRGMGFNGMDDDRDGLIDEQDETNLGKKRKNFMIFLGKHNFQISNEGMQSEEMQEECYEDCEEEEEYNDYEDDYDDHYHGNRYKNNKYRNGSHRSHGSKYRRNRFRMGPNYGHERGYYRNHMRKGKRKRPPKKYQKKYVPKVIDQYSDYEDEEEEGDYGPTFLNYHPAINRRTHIWFPWLKNLLGQINAKVYNAVQKLTSKDPNKDVVPNGFLVNSSSDYNKKGESDIDSEYIKRVYIYGPSEAELKQLLLHPKVIEFLKKLNETLENESTTDELNPNERNIRQNNTLSLSAEELLETKQIHNFSQQLPNNYELIVNNSTNSLPNVELKAESSQRSVKHASDNEPQLSSNSYQFEDYKTSFDEMDINDEYPMNMPYVRPDMPTNSYFDPDYEDLNAAYGGLGSLYGQQIEPNYWSQFAKKKRRRKKKKYYTIEKPYITTGEYKEEMRPPIKEYSTIQVIRTGPKYSEIRPDEDGYRDRSLKGLVKGLPGFRSLFRHKQYTK